MVALVIALHDGFEREPVVIRVDGREVFRGADVQTQLLTGYADSVEVPVAPGEVEVEIELPARGLVHRVSLRVRAKMHLGVSVGSDGIEHQVSDQPFGYA